MTKTVVAAGASGAGVRVLVLGPEGAGKTCLVRMIKRLCAPDAKSSSSNGVDYMEAVSTVGVELDEANFKGTKFILREVGGSFAPLWHKYYEDSDVLMFCIDMSDSNMLAQSTLLLHRVVSAKEFSALPVYIVYTKSDSPLALDQGLLETVLRPNDIRQNPVIIWQVSASSGHGVLELLEALRAENS